MVAKRSANLNPQPARAVHDAGRPVRRRRGFTLVELLVVVSIIALLISILLPSLKKARDQAKMVKCAANQRAVGQAIATYLAENGGVYPPSYVYPFNAGGAWSVQRQNADPVPYGYLHWSYFLFANGKVKDTSFQCPNFNKGGAPRTNPGPDEKDWEAGGQIDDGNNGQPNALVDRQAPRMAYTMNAAIVPRNKFTRELQDGQRLNVLVQENKLKRPGDTVLGTEFLRNWRALGVNSSGQFKSKSHRPINVFYHLGSSFNEYQAPLNSPGFIYGTKGLPKTPEDYGLLKLAAAESQANILDYTQNVAQINAVGRHHPGGDSAFGGTANFFFIDTHVERMTPFESVHKRRWGDRYYSLNGANEVLNYRTNE